MWKLTIEDDEQKQISLPLVHNQYGVGRDESNEIRLTERNISRKHAVLAKNGEGWVVRDLESYNGTYVNNNRVAGEQHVSHNDVIQLGDYRLEFIDEAKLAPAIQEQAATTLPLAPHHRPDRLVVVVGPQPGQEFFLDRENFSLGRSEEADISVNHSSVSRLHAELFAVGNGRYEIIDKGSANGIRINGQEVRRGFIEAGDALELGDVRLRFVGAGKTFRAGFDRSQALPAVTGLDLVVKGPSKAAPAGSSSILKMVGVGALLGVVGVGATAAYVATRPEKPKPAPTGAVPEDDGGTALLEEAKQLRDKGELEAAHKKITSIPEGSSALKDPSVAEIEGAWADKLFKEAEGYAESDPAKQVELLWKIATTPTVDEARRRKASTLLREVGVDVPEDPAVLIKPGTPMPTNFVPRAPPPRPTASASTRAPGVPDREAIEKPKNRLADLQSRMGSLGPTDLKLLIGLCQQEGNMQCAQAAAKRLGEVQAAGTSAPSSTAPKK